jgi:flagellar biosynthetic protein FliQ
MEYFHDLFQDAFKISLISIGIPLIGIFILGLFLAVLQAATQIQDQVLSFFPKIGLCFLIVFFLGPLFAEMLSEILVESIKLSSQIK